MRKFANTITSKRLKLNRHMYLMVCGTRANPLAESSFKNMLINDKNKRFEISTYVDVYVDDFCLVNKYKFEGAATLAVGNAFTNIQENVNVELLTWKTEAMATCTHIL